MENLNEQCVVGFIEHVWNRGQFEMAANYLHPDFRDHSMPEYCQNKYGLILYLKTLGKELFHETRIEEVICQGELVVLRFSLVTKPKTSGEQEQSIVSGYRYFRMSESRITDHWELIQAIKPFDNQTGTYAVAC